MAKIKRSLLKDIKKAAREIINQEAQEKEEDVNNVVIAYLNRLSDLFFVLSRWVNNKKKVKEFLWNPNFKD